MKAKVDISEMERQRYDNIKKTNKYLELNILIGVENDVMDGYEGKMPVVTTEMKHCTSKEVSCLYSVLQEYISAFESEYPFECIMAKMTTKSHHAKTVTTPIKENNIEDKESKNENTSL